MNTKEDIKKLIKDVEEDIAKTFKPFPNIETACTHAGHDPLATPGLGHPVVCPISLSTTFQQKIPGEGKYDYSRGNNYTRESLEKCLAKIEDGDEAITYGSGLASINAMFQTLSKGDHFVCYNDLYGGTNRLFRKVLTQFGLTYDAVDMRDHTLFKSKLKPETKVIWIETPSNPLMTVVDIAEIVKIAKSHNKDIIVVVDNTFMSSYFQRPLNSGADVVMHSMTKYLNGHSDVVMGCLVVKNNPKLVEKLRFVQYAAGAVPSAFDCYLALRGLRTLAVRMKQHMKNGLAVARFLEQHPNVEKVIHPGLKSHPQYEVAKKQTIGYSGMVACYLKGSAAQTDAFVRSLKVFYLAESLGGFESLVEIPSIMTHASVPEETRKELGISDNLIRFSVGLEDTTDLIEDLENCLGALSK